MKRRPRVLAGLAVLALLASPATPARAQDEPEPSAAYGAVVGLGAALGTLVYSPVKVAYAGTGLVLSSLAFLWTFGDVELTRALFTTTVGGDYVLTPSHLEGSRPLRFTGGS